MLPRLFLLYLVLLSCACAPRTPPAENPDVAADLILTNARVYTLDWPDPRPEGGLAAAAPYTAGWYPDAQAVAISEDRIVAVGSQSEVAVWRGDGTRNIDLKGATVVPGLVDSHTHAFQLGLLLNRVNLVDVATEEQAVALIAERARHTPAGEWIIGHGWDEGAWADRYPDKRLLSAEVPDHPVFMRSLHSFAGWGNQMALERAGVTAQTPVPSGGEMPLAADGTPAGLFLNTAVSLLEDALPATGRSGLRANALAGVQQMVSDGFVTVHEAGLNSAEMEVLTQLETQGLLPLRIYAMLSVRDEELARRWLQRGPDQDNDSMLVTRAIKAFYDGALGSRGASLLQDYSDRPGHRGVSGKEYGFVKDLVADMMHAGFQAGIHAIGDAGNRDSLDFIEGVAAAEKKRNGRHRIEHAQVLHPVDLPRLGELGVIASMQPPHAVEDKTWAEARLGPERVKGAYAWRTMRRKGTMLIFSSDNPGSDHSIFYGLHSAVTRRDKQGSPVAGWYPDQVLNMDEALRAYTRWPAYAAFREKDTGVIKAGHWADLTVMDVDPFVLSEANPAGLLEGQIRMTVVAGKVVYEQ